MAKSKSAKPDKKAKAKPDKKPKGEKKGKSADPKAKKAGKKDKKDKGKKGGGGCFGGGDKKGKKGASKDKKGGKGGKSPKAAKSTESAKSAGSGIKSTDSVTIAKSKSSKEKAGAGSPSKSVSKTASAVNASRTSLDKTDPSLAGSEAASRKLRFDETVRVKEIPDKFAARAEISTHGQVSQAGSRSSAGSVTRKFPKEGSELDLGQDPQMAPKYGDPYFGALTPQRTSCPQDAQRLEPDLYSMKSMTLDEPGPIFDPNRCPPYSREELISVTETLVLGINDRESLKNRYDEETTRLAMNAEFYHDKVEDAKAKLECLRAQQKQLDNQLQESVDLMSRNFIQLTRERKRIAGAVDLREDFDRHLQQQITTKTKFVKDYAQILGKLEGLVDDSSLAWLQRETMISTESEALERLHASVEKEHNSLQGELHRYESLYVAQTAQNGKLGQVVEMELEKYSKKQQEIIRYNEKRIRALEGCIRTMQLDREVMYSEIAENRNRLREVLESRVMVLMEKVRQYKEVLRGLEMEINTLTYMPTRSDNIVPATQALQSYIRLVANIDVGDFSNKVNTVKTDCDASESQWSQKKCQKRELTDIRKTYVEKQRRQMLVSEDEYFLMEPVDVPGAESQTNFQRSIDCFEVNHCRRPQFAAGTEQRTSMTPAINNGGGGGMGESMPPDAISHRSSKLTGGGGDASTIPERPMTEEANQTVDFTETSRTSRSGKSLRKRTVQTIVNMPKRTMEALGSGLKKFSHAVKLTH